MSGGLGRPILTPRLVQMASSWRKGSEKLDTFFWLLVLAAGVITMLTIVFII